MIRAVFFDLDGTLVDSNEFHVVAWARAFEGHGLSVPREILRAQIGKGADLLIPDLFPDLDEKGRKALADEHGTIFNQEFIELVKPFPAATQLVEHLQGAGLKIVLASSSARKEIDHYADLLKIADRVSATVSLDDVGQSKPAPDIFALALKKARVAPEAALVVGDTPYDGKAAAKCGIPALLLRSGGFSDAALRQECPKRIFTDLADVFVHKEFIIPEADRDARGSES